MSKATLNDIRVGFIIVIKWIAVAIVLGIVVGVIGSLFSLGLERITEIRGNYKWLIVFLPIAGILITFMYRASGLGEDQGTNRIFRAVRTNATVKTRRAPLVFISTLISHLVGASVGREGAALQIGGSVANTMAKGFRFKEEDKRIIIIAGMAACFTALFGTPFAASVFAIAVISSGVLYYQALLPALISSIVAKLVSMYWFDITPDIVLLGSVEAFSFTPFMQVLLIAGAASIVSVIFCLSIKYFRKLLIWISPNPYLRSSIGGCILLLLIIIFGYNYCGAGFNIIDKCLDSKASNYAFLLKMVFTIIAVSAGVKGGEIVPALTIGAALGFTISNVCGFDLGLMVGCGMISMFCGITNCPIASVILGLELFQNIDILPYLAIASVLTYVFSGYISIYEGQEFSFSKYKLNINQ